MLPAQTYVSGKATNEATTSITFPHCIGHPSLVLQNSPAVAEDKVAVYLAPFHESRKRMEAMLQNKQVCAMTSDLRWYEVDLTFEWI